MRGIGAVNMSMGGAATAQPVDINGALQWNPVAGISAFDKNIFSKCRIVFSAPELSSTVPTSDGPFSGVTKDDRGRLCNAGAGHGVGQKQPPYIRSICIWH